MNQQQKDAWLAALRSGRYRQGRGQLRKNGRYCCLGVAAEVCGISSCTADFIKQCVQSTLFGDFVFLPGEIQQQLSCMNDQGKSFAEIADYIEQNVPPTE